MKLNKLYCSNSECFETINFNKGLNIVLAEVRDPKNTTRSTHDLGKSLLATIIDFCLLKEVKADYFLYKHYEKFENFTFYLEIILDDGRFCTIMRPVDRKLKISIEVSHKEMFYSEHSPWKFSAGIRKAKDYLNDLLSFEVLPNYPYRTLISYFLRDQASFTDVMKLSKFARSNDIDWKPIVAELLGINSKFIIDKYILDSKITKKNAAIKKASVNDTQSKEQEDRYKTILRIKKELLKEKEDQLKSLNFKKSDNRKVENLINDIDNRIQSLLKENYYLGTQVKNAENSLMEYESIDLEEISSLYEEIGIYFKDQVKRDYSELLQFNKEIYEERNSILNDIIKELKPKFENNAKEIQRLNDRKSENIKFITSSSSFNKLYLLEKEIINYKVEIEQLEEKIKNIDTAHNLEIEKQDIETNVSQTVTNLKKDIYKENPILNSIRKHFSDIIVKTLGDAASISVTLNGKNNVEFKPEIFDLELQAESSSSKDKGTTYKKLMCCAFDLALLATYSEKRFFRFVYHDGIFDGLDNRQKENLISVINDYIKNYNIQYIFSTIQDELPLSLQKSEEIEKLKHNKIVVKVLHDCGNNGRLFRMDPF